MGNLDFFSTLYLSSLFKISSLVLMTFFDGIILPWRLHQTPARVCVMPLKLCDYEINLYLSVFLSTPPLVNLSWIFFFLRVKWKNAR